MADEKELEVTVKVSACSIDNAVNLDLNSIKSRVIQEIVRQTAETQTKGEKAVQKGMEGKCGNHARVDHVRGSR